MEVFNAESIAARNILAQVASDDKFKVEDIPCTAVCYVEDAYMGRINPVDRESQSIPCLIYEGKILSVYKENPDPNDLFPCGTKEMKYMDGQEQYFRCTHFFTQEELAYLTREKGLFSPGFKAPENLRDNIKEVPWRVQYVGVYDSPICMMNVPTAEDMYACSVSTRINGIDIEGDGYNTLVDYFEPVEGLTPDTVFSFDDFMTRHTYEKDVAVQRVFGEKSLETQEEIEETGPQLSEEAQKEADISAAIESQIKAKQEEDTRRLESSRQNVDSHRTMMSEVAQKVQNEADANDVFGSNITDTITFDGESNSNQSKWMATSDVYSILKTQAKVKADEELAANETIEDKKAKQQEAADEFQHREDAREAQEAVRQSSENGTGEANLSLDEKKRLEEEKKKRFQNREDALEAQNAVNDTDAKKKKQQKEADEFQHREDARDAQSKATESAGNLLAELGINLGGTSSKQNNGPTGSFL